MATLGTITPVLRSFDEQKAREFYVDFLGFEVEFEHRAGENFPLYMGIVNSSCTIHLSEHYGDVMPGAGLRIRVDDLAQFAQELREKDYKYAKPGLPKEKPWGAIELTIADPFGNKLTFVQE